MISKFFIDRPIFATVLSIVIVLAGLLAMRALPVAQYPEIVPPQVVVSATGQIEYRPVTLGPIVDGLRVVRSGLTAGEAVVVNGLQRIRPGAQVQAVADTVNAERQ